MDTINEIDINGVIIDLSEVTEDFVEDAEGQTLARRCPECKDWFDEAEWDCYGRYGDLTQASLCESCWESDTQYASTLHRFVPGESESEHEYVLFGDHTGYGVSEECYDEPFDWFFELIGSDWTGRSYHHTSAWRGYYCSEKAFKDIVVLDEGWMTGNYSDVPWKKDTHEFLEALRKGSITPPAPLYVLFEPTSNVFSTAATFFAKAEDADALRDWLASDQPYDLHHALA